MKKILVFALLAMCSIFIVIIFWQQELKYSLPTPIPANYKTVKQGSELPPTVTSLNHGKGVFIHFYNPDCPCSRFNARHINSIIRSHSDSMRIVVVVPFNKDIAKAVREFGETPEYISDEKGIIAKACGVYSTPQAVIIDKNDRIFFRGNYNKTRYCTSNATNFAELALIALLNKKPVPVFSIMATKSYGCELPVNDKIDLF